MVMSQYFPLIIFLLPYLHRGTTGSLYTAECNSTGIFYQPDLFTCSQRYFNCSNGQPQLLFCDDGSAFDQISSKCVDVDLMGDCKKAPRGMVAMSSDDYQVDCAGKSDGNYRNERSICSPVEEVRCTNGVAKILFCPATTRYDTKAEVCTYPKYIDHCGGVEQLRTETEAVGTTMSFRRFTHFMTAQIVHDDHGMSFSCVDKVGNFANPQKPCSRMFVVCTPDGMKGAMCPSGSVFDIVSDRCEFPEVVADCGGHSTSSTPTTVMSSTEKSPMNCEGLDPGNYPNPLLPCSNSYYVCTGLMTGIVQFCPGKTVFDAVLNRCGYKHEVAACGGSTTAGTSPSSSRITVVTTIANDIPAVITELPFSCADRPIDKYTPPGIECPEFYYDCSTNGAAIIHCPIGHKYHEKIGECKPASEVRGCAEFRDIPDPFCSGKLPGFYAKGTSCTKFLFCVVGHEFELNCPPMSAYSNLTNQCDELGFVQPPCGRAIPLIDFNCTDVPDDKYAAPGDCRSYFSCVNHTTTKMRCPEGLAFNMGTRGCTSPLLVDRCHMPVREEIQSHCVDLPDGIYADPDNCRRSLLCAAHRSFTFYCWNKSLPYFDPKAKRCAAATPFCSANTSLIDPY